MAAAHLLLRRFDMQKMIDGVLIDLTPNEIAEVAKQTALAALPKARTRTDVLADLAAIDTKSIRALREGNATRIAELETQAQSLRTELGAL